MRFLLLAVFAVAAHAGHAQSFSSPESVEYDALRHRWLVSQNGSNRLNTYNPATGALALFSAAITSGPHGLATIGDTLYACDGGWLRGFALATGTEVFTANLNASFLNGLASDGRRYLFATDFSTKKVYRVDAVTGSFHVLATTVRTPNGIYYDGARRRCVFVTWGSGALVQALSLTDSTVSTLATTTLSNIDGITRDAAGQWYVSAWGTNALHRFDSAFAAAPTLVRGNLSNPADIASNTAGDSIAIPNAGSANNVVFYSPAPLGVAPAAAPALLPLTCWPNPATTGCTVTLATALPGAVLWLRDGAGRVVGRQPLAPGRPARFERGTLPAGFYTVALYDAHHQLRARQKVAFVD